MADPIPYPKRITRILEKWHAGAVTPQDCKACSSSCCSHGGFAIFENVEAIFALYQRGELKREGYEFPPNLSFLDFVKTYFDVWAYTTGRWFWKKRFAAFYMRSLSSDGHLISIPAVGGSYHVTRSELFDDNPWLNKGCVFLSKPVENWPSDDKDESRHCILHHPESSTRLTQKPIDCVFFVCSTPLKGKVPTKRFSRKWFRALAVSYPHGLERFLELAEKDQEKDDHPTTESNVGLD